MIVFTHGYTGTFTDYTFLFEDLFLHDYGACTNAKLRLLIYLSHARQ